MQAYRKDLLTKDTPDKPRKPKAAPKRASRDQVLALKADVRKCEERVKKLNDMRDKLAKKLADPALYDEDAGNQAEPWQRKYSEVMNALDRADDMWMKALEKLEKAQA